MSRSRIVTFALVISLAINLLFVGAIIGRIMFGPPHGAPMPMHLGWIVRQLPEEKRAELRPDFEAHLRRTAPLRREMFAAQRDFETILGQPELDEVELREALKRLRTASEDFQSAMHEQMADVVVQLTAEQRERLVNDLRERSRRGERMERRGEHVERRGERERPPPPPG